MPAVNVVRVFVSPCLSREKNPIFSVGVLSWACQSGQKCFFRLKIFSIIGSAYRHLILVNSNTGLAPDGTIRDTERAYDARIYSDYWW